MRTLCCFSAVILMGASQLAFAQEGQYSQTLDEQKARVEQGQTAVPRKNFSGVNYSDRKHPPESWSDSGAIPALPLEVQTSGDISYITGGIGDEEEAQLRGTEKEYNFRLLMTSGSGEYVSGVQLRITDSKGGEVLSVQDAGPYFYAKLKPGRYMVEATAPESGDRKFQVNVSASGGSRQHVMFRG